MSVRILQQNAQKSELAQLEIVRRLDYIREEEEFVALIQEPFKPKEKRKDCMQTYRYRCFS